MPVKKVVTKQSESELQAAPQHHEEVLNGIPEPKKRNFNFPRYYPDTWEELTSQQVSELAHTAFRKIIKDRENKVAKKAKKENEIEA